MGVAAEAARLPFCEERSEESMRRGAHRPNNEWFLALRHARVPLHPNDRLLVLYGHPFVLQLGLYAATDRALAGEPVVYLDGANTFDPFVIGRVARTRRQPPRKALSLIHVARAFTCHQMERLVSDCLAEALDRYQARMAVLSGLFETLYDEAVRDREVARLWGRMREAIDRLTQRGYAVLCLCPPAPALARGGRPCLDQLCGQADRVIHVREEQGVIHLDEEGPMAGSSWEVVRTALECR
jgi:hypothetical protein